MVVAAAAQRDPIIAAVEAHEVAADVVALEVGALRERVALQLAPRIVTPEADRPVLGDCLLRGELRAAWAGLGLSPDGLSFDAACRQELRLTVIC